MRARWVGTGEYYPPTVLLGEGPARQTATAGSGPRNAGWSGSRAGAGRYREYGGGGDGPAPTPAGPGQSGPASLPWCRTSQNAASWPIKARFQVISCKVSQNQGVSPKYHEKACVSPCFQNGSRKSPLEILRFPKTLAFSPKELMGLFWPDLEFYVKMTKCRLNVHWMSRAKGSSDTPTSHAASCLCDWLLI